MVSMVAFQAFDGVDSEARIRQLEEDLKNAREMNACVNTSLKSLATYGKQGSDEDLNNKLDKILRKLENVDELEKKVDSLRVDFAASQEKWDNMRGEIKLVAENVAKSEEMKQIIDTVDTSVGYSELFVKDFGQIHSKILEMTAQFSLQFGELMKNLQDEAVRIEKMAEKLDSINELLCNLSAKVEKLPLGEELAQQMGAIATILMIFLRQHGEKETRFEASETIEKDSAKEESEETEEKEKNLPVSPTNCIYCSAVLPKKLRADGVTVICSDCGAIVVVAPLKEGHTWRALSKCSEYHFIQSPIETDLGVEETCQVCGKQGALMALRCVCNNCNGFMPKDVPLREDGISIECPKCGYENVLVPLEEGQKWMYMTCGDYHLQQVPLDKKHSQQGTCKVCGKVAYLCDPQYKCWNEKCKAILHRHLKLREDGVSVECEFCKYANITGHLKQGHKWMDIFSNGDIHEHFHQFPNDREEGDKEKCQICGEEGDVYDVDKRQLLRIWTNIKPRDRRNEPEPKYKCFKTNCGSLLTSSQRRQDGVSVACLNRNCSMLNIVTKLDAGYKWMYMKECFAVHFQQVPLHMKEGEIRKCRICQREGLIRGCNGSVATTF